MLSLCPSPAMREVSNLVREVAYRGTILIQGETGTGKEVVANAIHELSPQVGENFVIVNCGNQNEGIMGSELFGHEKGSFTGAVNQHIGFLEKADKGTIFFDEIGELPLELQKRLLRVLQDKTFTRLGSTEERTSDFRVISATNRDLNKAVQNKTFREDLLYRLNTVTIRVPALRNRKEDIVPLAYHFIRKFVGDCSDEIVVLLDAQTELLNHRWPGNVRELQSAMERASIKSRGHTRITKEHLMFQEHDLVSENDLALGSRILSSDNANDSIALDAVAEAVIELSKKEGITVRKFIRKLKCKILINLLDKNDGNKIQAAELMGMSRETLYRTLRIDKK